MLARFQKGQKLSLFLFSPFFLTPLFLRSFSGTAAGTGIKTPLELLQPVDHVDVPLGDWLILRPI